MHSCLLNIHGVRVKVTAQQSDTIEKIAEAYNLFLSPTEEDNKVEVVIEDDAEIFTILARNNMFAFHAAAYENTNRRGIILPGSSGSGKTSIAFSALDSGHPLVGDDVILCHVYREDFILLPFKNYLNLKQDGQGKKYSILEHHPDNALCNTYARSIVFPQIVAEGITRISRITDFRMVYSKLIRTSIWVKDSYLRKKQAEMLKELAKLPAFDMFLGSDHKERQRLAIEILDEI